MSEAFDFDAFIASPSQADNNNNTSNNSNQAGLDTRGQNGSFQGNTISGNHNGGLMPSLSDHGLENQFGGGLGSVAMSFMNSSGMSNDQMVYGSFTDQMTGADMMAGWDFSSSVNSFSPRQNFSMLGQTLLAADPVHGDRGHVNAVSVSDDPKDQAAHSYHSSITAHHTNLLGNEIRTAINLNAPQVGPGSSIFHPPLAGPSRSAPAVPRSQVSRKNSGGMTKAATAPNNVPRPTLSLQERRRLSRHSAKQVDQATQLPSSVNVSGRGAKRSMDGDSGQISSNAQSNGQPGGQGNGGFEQVSPEQNMPSMSQSYASDTSGATSPVFSGHYATQSGQEVSTTNRYSASGVDVLGILSRAITRPNPQISLGPVDLSCSFTISDAHHPEQPLVYASETFCQLTGYSLEEILGRNCRFLQSPGVTLHAGDERKHTDNRAVEHLKRHLSGFQECQASLINYRKDRTPFINLVTVVPVSWSNPNQVDFLVGFQVDLVEQPGAILERKEDGSYVVNYRSINDPPLTSIFGPDDPIKDTEAEVNRQAAIAQDILDLIHGNGNADAKQWSRVLLENSHDLIYVLSLKGTFLYVSPSIERILGFKPEEVIGKSISEFCHPSDVVPVFRELKDSTSNASIAAAASRTLRNEGVANPMTKGGGGQAGPRVNLILRMRHKHDGHRWIESTGKLHLEQGKGRKVVISSGRSRPVYNLAWEHVRRSAELAEPSFWTKLSIDGLLLSLTGSVEDVLGFNARDLRSRHLLEISNYEAAPSLIQALRSSQSTAVSHMMGNGKQNTTPVLTSFYPSSAAAGPALPTVFAHVQRASNDSAWMIPNVTYPKGGPQPAFDATGTSIDSLASVFAELSTYRSSSWVFEMHQLKNVNRRLKDEIRALRRQSRDHTSMRPPTSVPAQSPASPLDRQSSESVTPADAMLHAQNSAPIKRRPDHGHGHRQHLRPLATVQQSSSTDRSGSSSSEFSPFPERNVERRSGSGEASDETGITTAMSLGETSEKDGSGSGSESRRDSGSEET